ncbi:MAG: helix-turn-helix domain-containing protein [Firmicutes bacterium]|nr:helix-turn-helix domain-containing protein [Bacillota bacterium]
MHKLAERLVELRQEKGYTTRKLGADLNVSCATISRWEKGINEPDITTIIKLSEYFDVSVLYLLGIEGH